MRKVLAVALFVSAVPDAFHFHAARALATTYIEFHGASGGDALQALPVDEVSHLQVRQKVRRAAGKHAVYAAEVAPPAAPEAEASDSSTRPSDRMASTAATASGAETNSTHCSGTFGLRVPCERWIRWPLLGGLSFWPHDLITHPSVLYVTEAWERLGRWQELIFIPCLLGVLCFARFWLLQGIVVVQLITHFVHLFSPFECNPLLWCNMGALVFGVLYTTFSVMSLHYKDEDHQPIKNRFVSWAVLFMGFYILVSHVAAFFHYGQYRQVFPFVAWPEAVQPSPAAF